MSNKTKNTAQKPLLPGKQRKILKVVRETLLIRVSGGMGDSEISDCPHCHCH